MQRTDMRIQQVLPWVLLPGIRWRGWYFAWVLMWRFFDSDMTSFMQHRLEMMQENNPKASLKHRWVQYKCIPIHLKRAVVASEDDTFVGHIGIDLNGMQMALDVYFRRMSLLFIVRAKSGIA